MCFYFQKKFLSCLLTLKTEVDSETLVPASTLTSSALEWCASVGSKAQTVEDILGGCAESGASHPPDQVVMKAIQVIRVTTVKYSEDLKFRLVWILNGQKEVGLQIVWISNGI